MEQIVVSKLLSDEQLELCKLLIKAEYTVRLTSTDKGGKKVKVIEYAAEEGKK